MAFVTDSNRPEPIWQPPPAAYLAASGAASEVHPLGGSGVPGLCFCSAATHKGRLQCVRARCVRVLCLCVGYIHPCPNLPQHWDNAKPHPNYGRSHDVVHVVPGDRVEGIRGPFGRRLPPVFWCHLCGIMVQWTVEHIRDPRQYSVTLYHMSMR